MKEKSYLITTSVGTKSWKVGWDTKKALELDHPCYWILEKTEKGFLLKPNLSNTLKPFELSEKDVQESEIILPVLKGLKGPREIRVQISKLEPITPAYAANIQNISDVASYRGSTIQVYQGAGARLTHYREIHRAYGSLIEHEKIFAFLKTSEGYKIKSYRPHVYFVSKDEKKFQIQIGTPELIPRKDFEEGHLEYDIHWWKVQEVPRPEPLRDNLDPDKALDDAWFNKAVKTLIFGLIAASIIVQVFIAPNMPKEEIKKSQHIVLKSPKFLPPEIKKEEPKPIPPKPKKPPAPPKKKEQPKKVKLAPKKDLPPPPKHLPPPPPKQEPKPLPPKPVAPPPPPPQQIQIAKSLEFLSVSKKAAEVPPVETKNIKKYQSLAPQNLNDLMKQPKAKKKDDTIDTKSARLMKDDDLSINGRKNASHTIGAKVALGDVYDKNAKGSLSGSRGGLGISGEGKISEEEILKVLNKHLSQFQYCYEKALLLDSSLSGGITLEWEISSTGKASHAKVVKSEMSNKVLFSCMIEKINKLSFSPPSMGSVIIEYPFSFSGSSL